MAEAILPYGPARAVLVAIRRALLADGDVSAIVQRRIYDAPPDKPQYPFVRLGDAAPTPRGGYDGNATTVQLSLEIYSRPRDTASRYGADRSEALAIVEAIAAALHRKPEKLITGPRNPVMGVEYQTYSAAPMADGLTWRAIITFEIRLNNSKTGG